MKLLTKVKIINWHYFWNETIEVKPLVFLTGVNASGKSTLIDALQVVLLGDTTGRFFNKAAMDKSNRTLRGYLRGEIGDTIDGGFKYLRNGRFTSYIALEFFDDLKEQAFTMGIVFDSYEDGSEEHRFFCLEDKIPENEFIENNIPMEYKTLNKYFNENYHEKYTFFDSNRNYADYLKKRFGGLKDKYFSLLKKATSFSPITDITTFITEYVCDPQADINLDVLQENILEYKRLEEEAKAIKERIGKLEEISSTYSVYKSQNENYVISQYIVEKCQLEQSKEKLKLFEDQIAKNEERINQIELELADFGENLAELNRQKVTLIQSKASNDTQKLTQELYKQKKDTESEINEINRKIATLSQNLNNYIDGYLSASEGILSNLVAFNKESLEEDKVEEINLLIEEAKKTHAFMTSFKQNTTEKQLNLTKQDLEEFRKCMISFKQKVSSLAITITKAMQVIQKKIRSLQDEQVSMQKGVKPYSRNLVLIKEELEKELEEKFNTHIEVNIFADLIDVKDPSWSNAIEGYLYNQKFNLFVAPKYYFEAYSILRKLLLKFGYYQTALVDQERIIERNYTSEYDSLAEEIITNDEGARAYTNFLIGRIYKAKDVDEARNFGNGITKECDLYRNYTLTRMNPRLYQESFIGRGISDRFLEEKAKQLSINASNLNVYRRLQDLITTANTLEVVSSTEVENMLDTIGEINSLDGLKTTLAYLESQLKEQDTALLESLDRRIAKIEEDINSVEKDKEASILEKGNLIKENETIKEEKIKNEKESIKIRESELQTKYDPFLVKESALPIFKEQIKAGKNYNEIYGIFQSSMSRLQYVVSNAKNQLVKLRKEYGNYYHLSFDYESESNDEFEKELTEFRDVKLPSYEEQIVDSYHKATKQFKDDFIFKLRSSIEEVEDQINNLNEALKQSKFGKDSYKFTVKPSTQYRRYYDMLRDDLMLESGEDDSAFVEKYKDVMEELFRQIVDVGDGESKKNNELLANIELFTDYRTYLDFDLIVIDEETKEEQRLSKMIKKKSGGETQTPFYISILASFSQLYRANEEGELGNTIRIIIFDEAFSKMDPNRFKESVKLLRKFNLQVILSAPSDKISKICSLVDETLLVLHDKNKSFVRLFEEEK